MFFYLINIVSLVQMGFAGIAVGSAMVSLCFSLEYETQLVHLRPVEVN